MVGARYEDSGGGEAGAAYVFERDEGGLDAWGEVKKLTASDASELAQLGESVAVDNDTVLVGAWAADVQVGGSSHEAAGAAYIFQQDSGGADNWGEVAKLTSSDASPADYFGRSVSLDGDRAIVGAYGEDNEVPPDPSIYLSYHGAAYVFERDQGGTDNWGEVTKLNSSDNTEYGGSGDSFGRHVALSGDTGLIVAPGEDTVDTNAGAAYVFDLLEPKPTASPGPTPTPVPPEATEMELSLVSGGGCGSDLSTCVVPVGDAFVVSVDATDIPAAGYVGAQAWIHYGDDLGDQANQGAVKTGLPTWPDCNGVYTADASDEGGSSNLDSVSFSCTTFVAPPGPVSHHTGSLFTISLTCTMTESSTLIDLIAHGEDPALVDGTSYIEAALSHLVPTLHDLMVDCAEETTDRDSDGCADLAEVGSDEALGGLRDHTNPYDFYDVPGLQGQPPDGIVDLSNDILGVILHYAPNGTEPEYDVVFDRGPAAGPNPWNMTAPDGVIDLSNDVLGVISQHGHDCG